MSMQEPLNVTTDEHGPATPAASDERIQRNIVGRQMRMRHLVQAIINQPGTRASDLAEIVNVPASTISQDISPLVDLGLVYKKPAKGGGAGLFFFTTPANVFAIGGGSGGSRGERNVAKRGAWQSALAWLRG